MHINLQAENSMLRLDKERLVREVNTTKVPSVFTHPVSIHSPTQSVSTHSLIQEDHLDFLLQAELEDSVAKSESQGKLIIQLEDHVEQLQAISTPYRFAIVVASFITLILC